MALTTNHGESGLSRACRRSIRRQDVAGRAGAGELHVVALDRQRFERLFPAVGGARPERSRGRPDFDLRHALTASASYEPARLRGWALDAVFRARTGFPITVLQAEEYQGITLMNAFRPDLVYGQPIWLSSAGDAGRQAPESGGVRRHRHRPAGHARTQFHRWLRHVADRSRRAAGIPLLRAAPAAAAIEAFNALNHANFGDPVAVPEQPGIRAIDLDAEHDARDRQPGQRTCADTADGRAPLAPGFDPVPVLMVEQATGLFYLVQD